MIDYIKNYIKEYNTGDEVSFKSICTIDHSNSKEILYAIDLLKEFADNVTVTKTTYGCRYKLIIKGIIK